jgi:DNA gyrase subunit A
MVQDFSSRYPLLAGHGNFGSVDDDPPAAMRYTETRLASISHDALLREIGVATVDFIGNFDNSQQEPVVLPAQLPFLLLNGSSGIAVGMATNIPPHNLGELIDGLIALIDHPDLSHEELLQLIPGPDFPTGGEIIGTEGVRDAYLTGRGSIPLRGVAQFEEIQPGRGRHRRPAIVVTELPYQVNKAAWIEKMADLVNQGRIEGILDIRDESDREGMRVVIELKREASPQRILSKLYKLTPLQVNFGAIMLALADSQPRQMSLRELLQHFLNFREQTLTRQYTHELGETEEKIHIREGLLSALEHLDEVIDILRHAPDGTTAKVMFQERFGFSDRQSNAILSMPLRRLTGLERQNLQNEFNELNQRREELRQLLTNHREFLKALKKELRVLRKKFVDPRRTRIQTEAERDKESTALAEAIAEAEQAEEEVILEFTQRGYVRRFTPKAFERQQAKQENQLSETLAESEDITLQVEVVNTRQELLVLTQSGKAYTIWVNDIPLTQRQSKGTPLISLLPQAFQNDPEPLTAQFVLPDPAEALDLVLVTQQGRIKRLPLTEFANLTGRGLTALKLKDDELIHALLAETGDQLVLATSGGRVLRFELNDEQLPVQSRTAQGQIALRLSKQEQLIGCLSLNADEHFLLISTQGYVKRMPVKALRLANRGDLGLQAMQFANKTDSLASVMLALPGMEIIVLTSTERAAKVLIDTIPVANKDSTGDRLFKLNRGEKIAGVAIASFGEEEHEG